MQEEFILCKQLHGRTKKFRDFQSDRQLFSVNMIYPGQNVSRCAQTVQEPCMTHCMLHRENFVAKDMSDEFSNVRSLTRYEIFHPYLSFSSYSILCPSLIEYRVMANCKGEKMSIINRKIETSFVSQMMVNSLQTCVAEVA